MFYGGGDPEHYRMDASWLNRLVRQYPIRLPLIGIGIAVIPLAVAYFTGMWRLAIIVVILLVTFVPLLIVGLVRKATQATKGPLRCTTCGAIETDSSRFNRRQPKGVNYQILQCNKCGSEWTEQI